MKAGEGFQFVQGTGGFKGFGVQLQRSRGGVATSAADALLLQLRRVRRAVGAQEELLAAGRGRLHQGQAVAFLLQHRQAVVVRPQAAHEERVAVVEQVVCRDGGRGVVTRLGHVLRRVGRGDVLEHHLQRRKVVAQGLHDLVDEHGFAIEDIHVGVGHFTVHQQQEARSLHGLQGLVGLADVGDAGRAVGGGAGRVELQGDDARRLGTRNLFGRGVVRQVQRHQRLEAQAGRQGRQDALPVGHRIRRRGDRWLEVGHDDGARKLAGRGRQHRSQRSAVAQVQVPVVGPAQGESVDGLGSHRTIFAPGARPRLKPRRVPSGSGSTRPCAHA